MNFIFYIRSILFGISLAVDASVISMANTLKNKNLKFTKIVVMASIFAFFQFIMPMISYFVGSTILSYTYKYIPYITLTLLSYLGLKMIYEGINKKEDLKKYEKLNFFDIIIQGVATSIDALTVGFSLSSEGFFSALITTLIIAIVTFILCIVGGILGKKSSKFLGNKAEIIGGIILIVVGLEMFVSNFI